MGLRPNAKHGFHIHQFDDISAADGKSTGDHFNPDGHAVPMDGKRLIGAQLLERQERWQCERMRYLVMEHLESEPQKTSSPAKRHDSM